MLSTTLNTVSGCPFVLLAHNRLYFSHVSIVLVLRNLELSYARFQGCTLNGWQSDRQEHLIDSLEVAFRLYVVGHQVSGTVT